MPLLWTTSLEKIIQTFHLMQIVLIFVQEKHWKKPWNICDWMAVFKKEKLLIY